jgi:hypothetical protein
MLKFSLEPRPQDAGAPSLSLLQNFTYIQDVQEVLGRFCEALSQEPLGLL